MSLNLKPLASASQDPSNLDGDNFRVPTGRGVLSAEEIEALLRPDIPEDAFEPPKQVVLHGMAELENQPAFDALEDDAAALAARMTLSLRRACLVPAIVTVKKASQAPLSHLVSQYDGEPVLVLFSDQGGAQVAGLTLDRAVAVMIIDRACGGSANLPPAMSQRTLSTLDKSILEEVLRPLAKALDPAFSVACIEANRTAAHALLPPGKAILAELSCQIDGVIGKAAFARLASETAHTARIDGDIAMGKMMTSLTARIASLNVPISRLSDLKAGSVLLLGLPTDQPVELLSGGHQGEVIAEGDVGRKGNRIAVRITKRKPSL